MKFKPLNKVLSTLLTIKPFLSKKAYFSPINFEEIFICLCVIYRNIMYICTKKQVD